VYIWQQWGISPCSISVALASGYYTLTNYLQLQMLLLNSPHYEHITSMRKGLICSHLQPAQSNVHVHHLLMFHREIVHPSLGWKKLLVLGYFKDSFQLSMLRSNEW
jgi:hypothetical protein